MGLAKLVAGIQLHTNAICSSGLAGACFTPAISTKFENPDDLLFILGGFAFTYLATLFYRNKQQEYDLLCDKVQSCRNYFSVCADEHDKKMAQIHATLNNQKEWFEFDLSTFRRMEQVYKEAGMPAIIKNRHLEMFGVSWACTTQKLIEYQNAVKMTEEK